MNRPNTTISIRNRSIFLGLLIMLALTFKSIAQPNEESHRRKIPLWWSVGPQMSLAGQAGSLFGLGMSVTLSAFDKFEIKTNAYFVFPIVKNDGVASENSYGSIANLSFLPGIKLYRRKQFFVQIFGGISYGEAHYKTKYTGGTSHDFFTGKKTYIYEWSNYNYIGIPLQLTFNFTRKRTGFDITLFTNYHKHPEAGVSLNFILGKFR